MIFAAITIPCLWGLAALIYISDKYSEQCRLENKRDMLLYRRVANLCASPMHNFVKENKVELLMKSQQLQNVYNPKQIDNSSPMYKCIRNTTLALDICWAVQQRRCRQFPRGPLNNITNQDLIAGYNQLKPPLQDISPMRAWVRKNHRKIFLSKISRDYRRFKTQPIHGPLSSSEFAKTLHEIYIKRKEKQWLQRISPLRNNILECDVDLMSWLIHLKNSPLRKYISNNIASFKRPDVITLDSYDLQWSPLYSFTLANKYTIKQGKQVLSWSRFHRSPMHIMSSSCSFNRLIQRVSHLFRLRYIDMSISPMHRFAQNNKTAIIHNSKWLKFFNSPLSVYLCQRKTRIVAMVKYCERQRQRSLLNQSPLRAWTLLNKDNIRTLSHSKSNALVSPMRRYVRHHGKDISVLARCHQYIRQDRVKNQLVCKEYKKELHQELLESWSTYWCQSSDLLRKNIYYLPKINTPVRYLVPHDKIILENMEILVCDPIVRIFINGTYTGQETINTIKELFGSVKVLSTQTRCLLPKKEISKEPNYMLSIQYIPDPKYNISKRRLISHIDVGRTKNIIEKYINGTFFSPKSLGVNYQIGSKKDLLYIEAIGNKADLNGLRQVLQHDMRDLIYSSSVMELLLEY
jgi:hypothetical protein